ncbi:MAG: hypothetical protein ACI9SE_001208 [Neolewinella sp.]|jgi:hypothetical protein
MSGQSRWWAIPGALIVLTGVLVFAGRPESLGEDRERVRVVVPELAAGELVTGVADVVVARDASGQKRLLAFGAAQALILVLPSHFAGKNVDVTLWRRLDDQREAEPWIQMRPLVRSDATLPMAGIVPGRYDIEVGLPDAPHLLVEAAAAPGEVSFVAATPVR